MVAGLHDYLKGDASTPKAPKTNEDWGSLSPGPYVGIVKANSDPLRAGRLKVFIPSLKGNVSTDFDGLIDCDYLSPFYGNKGLRHVKPGKKHTDSQFSYGFWAVPPDLETRVLVIFAEGKMEEAFWIGCVQEPLTNHMTPGIASSHKVTDELGGNTQEEYGSTNLPAGEVNRFSEVTNENYTTKDKPVHPLADTLMTQGLSADNIRGNTTSSAQRESPSQVFGMSTPGRLNPGATPTKVGANDSEEEAIVDRLAGHTFVMDDGAADGTNQLTRLRTASGHQLLMHDTEGVVYLANGSGKAFIEMAKDGTISVYSDGGINLRSGRDFNLHSDMNINFHAKGAINFTAEANVALNAEGYVFAMGDQGVFTSSQNGVIQDYALKGITSYTPAQQLHGAEGEFHLQGSQVHFNKPMGRPGSGGGTSIADWGPSWLKPDSDYVRIKVSGGEAGENALIDIDDDQPYINGVVNKRANKTTVTDFVTHEPYGRKSSTQYKKDYVNEAIEQIKKTSPEISSTELKLIKDELLKQPTVKAVADKLGKVVKLNDNIKLPFKDLNNLLGKATEIQSLINDPKLALQNFVYGKVAELKSTAVNFLKSKFKFF